MHEIVMKHNNMNNISNTPIIHINNIHFDNRIENLQFDIVNKEHVKNTKKKNRIIDLSEHGINASDIPTYVWYLKPDDTHGERFAIEIPNELSWRTTSSKKVSLKYKLEEAKKYLRNLKFNRPDIFELYSMNGDLTSKGTKLLKDYKRIIEMAGFSMNTMHNNKTHMTLEQNTDNLTEFEEYLLDNYNPYEGAIDINKAFTHFFC
jgi:predicted transcriptional regulator